MVDSKYVLAMNTMRAYLCAQTLDSYELAQRLKRHVVCVI